MGVNRKLSKAEKQFAKGKITYNQLVANGEPGLDLDRSHRHRVLFPRPVRYTTLPANAWHWSALQHLADRRIRGQADGNPGTRHGASGRPTRTDPDRPSRRWVDDGERWRH